MYTKKISDDYHIQEIAAEEFWPHWDKHRHSVFTDSSLSYFRSQHLAPDEKAQILTLNKNMGGSPLKLYLAVYFKDELVGWSFGDQMNDGLYYMRNSAILPDHRRKGLYSALVDAVLEILTEMGFQRIKSNHLVNNNAVIISKLKKNFIITGFEVDDCFGTLVQLSYFNNSLVKKVMDFRIGSCKPDEEVRAIFNLK